MKFIKKTITVVIPALNEEKGIGPVLKEIPMKKLQELGYQTEVMVIDNGSKDRTRQIALENGAKVIIQPVRGYGNAYKAGFANATGDLICTGDADLTYPFTILPRVIRLMEKFNYDFVNTNRLKYVNRKVMSKSHIFGNCLLTKMTQILFNSPFIDSQSGMWIFKKRIWNQLDVRSSGMAFSQELKIEAFIRGFRCAEIPVHYRMRAGKEKLNTVRDGIRTVSQMFHKKLILITTDIKTTFSVKKLPGVKYLVERT